MPGPWSSQLAGDLRRERERLLYTFLELRAILRDAAGSTFPGQAAEHVRLLGETEADYVSLVAAGAAAMQLETLLESADREATERELDTATLLLEKLASYKRCSIDGLDDRSRDNLTVGLRVVPE
jgi:hypothetical protein